MMSPHKDGGEPILFLVNMVAFHPDFRGSLEPTDSPGLIQLTQNQLSASSKLGGKDPEREIASRTRGTLRSSTGPTRVRRLRV